MHVNRFSFRIIARDFLQHTFFVELNILYSNCFNNEFFFSLISNALPLTWVCEFFSSHSRFVVVMVSIFAIRLFPSMCVLMCVYICICMRVCVYENMLYRMHSLRIINLNLLIWFQFRYPLWERTWNWKMARSKESDSKQQKRNRYENSNNCEGNSSGIWVKHSAQSQINEKKNTRAGTFLPVLFAHGVYLKQ